MKPDEQTRVANDLILSRLRDGAKVRFHVPTASMLPLLQIGDRVAVVGVRAADTRVGDLVVARLGDEWRVHRLIRRRVTEGKLWLVTKGDNGCDADGDWPTPEWVGVVTAVTSHGREYALDTWLGRGMGVLVAHISRAQCWLGGRGPKRARRIVRNGLALLIHAADWILRRASARPAG